MLLDINFDRMNGIAAIPHIKKAAPHAKVIMLTINDDDANITRALERGVDGYVVKTAGLEEVGEAIQRALAGQKYLDPGSLTTLIGTIKRSDPPDLLASLTSRELEVLKLLADGGSRVSIARTLDISVGTVIAHLRSIFQKLGVNKAPEAVAKAMRERLL